MRSYVALTAPVATDALYVGASLRRARNSDESIRPLGSLRKANVTAPRSATGPRWRALGGVGGPVAFVGAWSILGASRSGYSPIHDPISRLAAVGAPTRPAMTAAFLVYGIGVSLYATELHAALPAGAALAAATTAVATVGVAATPLGSALGGAAHATCAAVAYAGLALMPIAASRVLARQGRRRASSVSFAVGLVSAASLLASVLFPRWAGLFQRAGLTVGDAWIVATAIWLSSWPAGVRA